MPHGVLRLVLTVGRIILPIVAGLSMAVPARLLLLTAVVTLPTVVRNLIYPTVLVNQTRKAREKVPRIGKEREEHMWLKELLTWWRLTSMSISLILQEWR
jgi:hypothetical protein